MTVVATLALLPLQFAVWTRKGEDAWRVYAEGIFWRADFGENASGDRYFHLNSNGVRFAWWVLTSLANNVLKLEEARRREQGLPTLSRPHISEEILDDAE